MVLDVAGTSNGTFVSGERASLLGSDSSTLPVQVAWSNTSHAYVQHVSSLSANLSLGLYTGLTGVASGATMNVSTVAVLTVNIPAGEQVYWSPVTEWDNLVELNARKQNISLVDSRYVDKAQLELKQKLK